MKRHSAIRMVCAVLAAIAPGRAWHDPVHQMMTATALSALPPEARKQWDSEAAKLIEVYSLYPDIYANASEEVRRGMRPYCELNGVRIHNVSWNRTQDLAMLVYLRKSIRASLDAGDIHAAAQYAGTLAHFIEDSNSPSHALMPWDSQLDLVRDMLGAPPDKASVKLHAVIEHSAPAVQLGDWKPEYLEDTQLLDRIYAGVRANRAVILDTVRAAFDGDEARMDPVRARAADTGTRILADALYTVQVGR